MGCQGSIPGLYHLSFLPNLGRLYHLGPEKAWSIEGISFPCVSSSKKSAGPRDGAWLNEQASTLWQWALTMSSADKAPGTLKPCAQAPPQHKEEKGKGVKDNSSSWENLRGPIFLIQQLPACYRACPSPHADPTTGINLNALEASAQVGYTPFSSECQWTYSTSVLLNC